MKNILSKLLGHVRGDFSGKTASLRERAKASWIQNHLPPGSVTFSSGDGSNISSKSGSPVRLMFHQNSSNHNQHHHPYTHTTRGKPLALDDLLFSWGLCPSHLVEDQMTREQATFMASLRQDRSNIDRECNDNSDQENDNNVVLLCVKNKEVI